VNGDPNHYWVGWLHKNTIIQSDDNDHYVRPLQGTTQLTVHSVKVADKYQCQVYKIQDGSVTDQVTHQVSVDSGT